jgi:hypothetical protein
MLLFDSPLTLSSSDDYIKKQASRMLVLKVVRWLALAVSLLLFIDIINQRLNPSLPEWFFLRRSIFDLLVAVFILCPFSRLAQLGSKWWWGAFIVLSLLAIGFAFLRVIGVLFDSMAAFEAGEKMAVPGWSGMLIFGVFSQLPTVFFQRFPRQLG